MSLITQHCIPCQGGVPVLKAKEIKPLLKKVHGWKVARNHHLEKAWKFKNFKDALAFTNKVGMIAEQEGHHPDMYLGWGKVKIKIWTHKINGLTESDFILAAKIDGIKS